MPFNANNNREAVVVCARHVVKRPSKPPKWLINGGKFDIDHFISIRLIQYANSVLEVVLGVMSNKTPHVV